MEDFRRDYVREHLNDLTPEELLEAVPVEKRLAGLSMEQRLAGLSVEEIEAVLKRLKGGNSSTSP